MLRKATLLLATGLLAMAPVVAEAQVARESWSYSAPQDDPMSNAPWRTQTSGQTNPLAAAPWRAGPQAPATATALAATPKAAVAAEGVAPLVAYVERDRPLVFSKKGANAATYATSDAELIGMVAGLIVKAMIERSQGKAMVGQYGLVDPSNAMAADLAAFLANDRGGTIGRAPIALGPKDRSPLPANVEKARFVIDVRSSGSFGVDGGGYSSTARVYDAASGKIVSSQSCTAQRELPPKPGRGQARPSEEMLVKTALRVGADYCLAQFKDGLATLDTGPRRGVQASNGQSLVAAAEDR